MFQACSDIVSWNFSFSSLFVRKIPGQVTIYCSVAIRNCHCHHFFLPVGGELRDFSPESGDEKERTRTRPLIKLKEAWKGRRNPLSEEHLVGSLRGGGTHSAS